MPAEHELGGAHALHHRWNAALPPVLTVRDGDTVHFHCPEATGGQVGPASRLEDFLRVERRGHALTGPVFVEGAAAGDVLEVNIRRVRHGGWGWSSIVPGWGLLSERFTEPFFFVWSLDEFVSDSLAPARVPLRPFCGVLGVAPAGEGDFSTRPPGPAGGNLDVRDLTDGATLYLPVQHPGALFSVGDAHAAQGDGEVCLNGIETPAEVTLTFRVRRDFRLSAPMAETAPAPVLPGRELGEWLMIEAHPDPLAAAAAAASRMVDFIAARWGLSAERAYVLCSAAMSLRLSQVVNRPVTTVTAALPKAVFPSS